jgi:hypothetical protein
MSTEIKDFYEVLSGMEDRLAKKAADRTAEILGARLNDIENMHRAKADSIRTELMLAYGSRLEKIEDDLVLVKSRIWSKWHLFSLYAIIFALSMSILLSNIL